MKKLLLLLGLASVLSGCCWPYGYYDRGGYGHGDRGEHREYGHRDGDGGGYRGHGD